ncbi:zinc ribbon domain-containing protein [Treponema sp.]|uniref:zinc ribbon domain-containing protein n=1 Tax=Treponema sp. TaxID=166 RepID=UPI00257EB806|nr:zinc ribbon domain-containing protein [Treponema sp.]MBE6354697.1 zinc ribbon domain-containing protein [Treponema sp.]
MIFCGKCGKQLDEGVQVCPECGTSVVAVEKTDAVIDAESESEKNEKEKKGFTFDWWEVFVSIAIFAWNSFVITRNLSVHDGYIWVAAGVVINLGILAAVPKMVKDLFPGFKLPVLGLIVFIPVFIISMMLGFKSVRYFLANRSVELVNELIQKNYGKDGATCRKVEIDEDYGDNFYRGTAYLDNGNDLEINITYIPEDDWIEVSVPNL